MPEKLLSIDARMLFAGGIGTYLQNLLKRLRLEDALGRRVEIYVRTDAEEAWMRQHQPRATIKRIPHWIYGFREQFFWLKNLRGGAFWAPHFNIPWAGYDQLIVTLHDAAPLTRHVPFIYNVYGAVMYGRIKAKADAILTVSNFSATSIQKRAGITDIPLTVTPLAVDPVWYAATAYPPPYPFRYLVYVGNLKPHKNLVRLLQALELSGIPHRLVCVGPFRRLKSKDMRARRMIERMKESVICEDEVPDEQLRAIVKNADGLVLPSTYEGFGLPPLEAMASRVPVLVSWALPMPEVCGKSALYCDPYSVESIAEGLRALVTLPAEEKKRRLDEGYEHAVQFSWEKTAAQTMEVLARTLR